MPTYVEMSLPWNEETKPQLPQLLATLELLGYDRVVLDHTVKGDVPKQTCPIRRVDYPGTGTRRPLRQYTRLTLILSEPSKCHGINLQNEVIRSYDIFAIQPDTEKMLQCAINSLEPDLVSLDLHSRMYSALSWGLARQALDKGITLELAYGALTSGDLQSRSQLISAARMMTRVTKGGRGVVFSARTAQPWDLRAPRDVAMLGKLVGMKGSETKPARGVRAGLYACVSATPIECLRRAALRRKSHCGAVLVIEEQKSTPNSDLQEDFLSFL